MDAMRHELLEEPRRRYLRWSIWTFMGLLVVAVAVLPRLVSGGGYLRDPVVWTCAVAFPAYAALLWRLPRTDARQASLGFVVTTFAVTWIFTVLIQGSGYLVGNYAYLSVVVLLAAFFLDAKKTAAVAAANIAGVIAIHTTWGLSTRDLALSLAYLVIFSVMLVLIASLLERDATALARRSAEVQGANRDLHRMVDENRLLLDNTDDGILHLDEKGRLLSMNRRARDMAVSMAGLIPCQGERMVDLLPETYRAGAEDRVRRAARGQVQAGRLTLEAQGGPVSVEARLVRVEGSDGHLILVVTDVTAEVRREEEERSRIAKELELEKLEEVHVMQRDFINIASHELQTPLTPMRLQLHMLRDKQTGPLNSAQLRALDVLDRNTLRLSRLVDDILQIVRIDDEELRLRLGDVELVGLAQEVLDTCRDEADGRRVVLGYEGASTAWVRGDAAKLSEIIRHLVENGLKFTPAGGRVDVRILAEEECVRLEVQDTGIGIPDGTKRELFHPFRQVHTHQMRIGGTGLGLAICKGLVEAHRGSIEASSPGEGGGSTFVVRLPAAALDTPAPDDAADVLPADDAAAPGAGPETGASGG